MAKVNIFKIAPIQYRGDFYFLPKKCYNMII